ncbi:hypothetical protein ACI65C_001097 [Semiaphis heraclei]
MIKSSRTKRRRLQEEIALNELFNEDHYVKTANSLPSTSTNFEPTEISIIEANTNVFIQSPYVLETNVDNSSTYMSPNNFESIENNLLIFIMYTVIHFEVDDTVEAVPSYWFSEDKCAWPILRSNIKRFIEKKVQPNDLEFSMLKARKLCGEISSLSDAKQLATKAMCTSNLSGDDIRTIRMKKKHLKNTISDPPTFKNNDDNRHYSNKSRDNLYTLHTDDVSIHNNQEGNLSLEDDCKLKKARSSVFDVSSSDEEHQSNSSSISFHQPSIPTSIHQTSTSYTNEPSTSTYTYKPSTSTYQSKASINSMQPITDLHADILKKIYNTVIGIKLDVKENNYKITRLENTINDLKQSHRDTNIYQHKDKKTWDFPIKTLEELDKFEEKLNDDQFKSNVILEKSLYVRDSVGATVRSILYKMFDDNLLMLFSYIGQKKKKTFSALKSNNVIFDAVRKIFAYQNVPEQDIINPIKLHLAQAKARLEKKNNKNKD